MKLDDFNPLAWVRTTQHWFGRTERSSGFRPYLIFLIIIFVFAIVVCKLFGPDHLFSIIMSWVAGISVIFFILYFGIKCLQDPDFCRSERHIEAVKKLELTEQSGDAGPSIAIDARASAQINPPTMHNIENRGIDQ